MTRTRPTLAAPEESPDLVAGVAATGPYAAQSPPVVGLLLARAWRGEFLLLALVAFFIEGWWLAPTSKLSWTVGQRWVDLTLLLHGVLAIGVWPALAGPVIAERFERLGHLPIPLASSRRWTAAWVDLLGQCALALPLLVWGLVLWPAQPRMIALLQASAVLTVLGLEAGAWWRVGRRWWGMASVRPGLWLAVPPLVGLTLILIDPVGEMAREIGGLSKLGLLWQSIDPQIRAWWLPWLIDSLQQRWSWERAPLQPFLQLDDWVKLHLLWTAALWYLSLKPTARDESQL